MLEGSTQPQFGRAHGKVILIGEHAVIYGYPAVVLPLKSVGVIATVEPAAGPLMLDCALYHGPLGRAPSELQGLTLAIREILTRLKIPSGGLRIGIQSQLPPGRGLGSSAAVTAAVIRGIANFHHAKLSHQCLIDVIQIAETYTHGSPSGADAEAVISASALWFVKGQSSSPLHIKSVPYLLVADSGQSSDTRCAIESVRLRLKSTANAGTVSLDRLGELACRARESLLAGDQVPLGETLNLAHRELSLLGVSHPCLERLIRAANEAGALGSKLTGSGLGGCILTLARDARHAETLATALFKAGATSVWRLMPSVGTLR